MFSQVGELRDACLMFDKITLRVAVSFTAIITGGRFEEALACFTRMREADVSPNQSTMLSVLSACGHLGSLEMGKWIVSWVRDRGLGKNLQLVNALVDLYSKCGEIDTTRELFDGIEEKDMIL
ncbi:hypothetical protein JHK86_047145 [Glycine max]|nr:hypothetical protein JHK86_047145 [Glycine max]